jgi:hypothetical protein
MMLSARPDPLSAPTTASQRRDWNSHHSRPDNSFLNLAAVYALRGPVDAGALSRAVGALVSRHEALRTRFGCRGDELIQAIEPAGSAIVPRLAVAGGPAAPPAQDWLRSLVSRPFDLHAEVPFRAGLLAAPTAGSEHLFGVVMHHIISDQISMRIALEDLSEFLAAEAGKREPALAPLPVQFADYAAWWHREEQAGRFERSFRYWASQLGGAAESTPLPKSPATSPAAVEERWSIPVGTAALASRAASLCTTPYVLLLAMFSSALADLAGTDDSVFVCGTANRPGAALRRGIGRFTSGIALRIKTPRGTMLTDAVTTAHGVAMNAYAHAVVSLDAVLERGLLGTTTSPTPFANIAFQLVDHAEDAFAMPSVSVRPVSVSPSATKRDLHVTVERSAGQLALYVAYRPSALATDWIHQLAGEFASRLSRLCAGASSPGGRA